MLPAKSFSDVRFFVLSQQESETQYAEIYSKCCKFCLHTFLIPAKKIVLCFIALCSIFFTAYAKPRAEHHQADIVIYGGTSAGIIAAVQAAKMGKSVIVVSPDRHLGGLSSSGLGFTDTGDKSVIGGLARTFYQKVYQQYQQSSAWKWQKKEEYGNKGQGTPAIDGTDRTMWIFEPHVAEQVMEHLTQLAHVADDRGHSRGDI